MLKFCVVLSSGASWSQWFSLMDFRIGLTQLGSFSFTWRRYFHQRYISCGDLLIVRSSEDLMVLSNTASFLLPIIDVVHRDYSAVIDATEVAVKGELTTFRVLVTNYTPLNAQFTTWP